MERFAAENVGTPYFHRAIYLREIDIPDYLEVGIIQPDHSLWNECFDNRDSGAT